MKPDDPLKMVEPDNEDETLGWDDSYAIALVLKRQHPCINLEEISLNMIYQWTIALPNFIDDKELANDAILKAIFNEWIEEAI